MSPKGSHYVLIFSKLTGWEQIYPTKPAIPLIINSLMSIFEYNNKGYIWGLSGVNTGWSSIFDNWFSGLKPSNTWF